MDEFIVNLYEHKEAKAYQSLAVVLNAFMEFERLYFDVAKPMPKEKAAKQAEPCEFIADEEAARRARNRAAKAAESLQKACAIEDEAFAGKEDQGDL